MSSAPQHPGGTHRVDQPKASRGPLNSVADFASRAARSASQNAVNLGATRPGVTKMIAVAGASVLLIGGGIFAYNSMHQEENAFLASDDEYARVCQDATTGERVDDSECEKAGAQEPTANPSESASSDSSSSSSSHSGSSGSGSSGSSNSSTTTHHSGSNAFLWYYLGRQSAANSNGASASYIPRVGEKLSGGSTTRPSNGTVYSGVPSSGGGFEDSYRNAKKASTISSGKEISTKNTGKTSSARDNTTGTVSNARRNGTSGSNSSSSNSSKSGNKSGSKSGSSSSNKSGSKSGGSKGGFGGGSKSGGGHSGG